MAKTNKTCYTIIATTIIFLALSNALAQTKNAGEIKLNLTSDKKSLYPGEKIKLNITIENKGEYIHRLDFTAKIRYYGIPVESTERYSDRGFMKDKPQTLQDEEKIPYFAPPGEYEIIFKIEDHDVVKTEKSPHNLSMEPARENCRNSISMHLLWGYVSFNRGSKKIASYLSLQNLKSLTEIESFKGLDVTE